MKRLENPRIQLSRKIEKAEYDQIKNSGHMLCSNQPFSADFDYNAYSDGTAEYNDIFYKKLKKIITRENFSGLPIIIALYLFAALIVAFLLITEMAGAVRGGFIAFAAFLICVSTVWLICSIVNTHKITNINMQRQNVYPVSMNIDGTCSYYNTYDFTSATFYYIVSDNFWIRVSDELYKKATQNKKLIGAVIDTGSKNLFYALYVI